MKKLSTALAALALLAACSDAARTLTAGEPGDDANCALDGMTLKDFPGPKAQIVYHDGQADYFCGTTELFAVLFGPEGKRPVAGVYVQDMGKADWERPRGNWIEAAQAYYVAGSAKRGAMGATLVSFAKQADAQAFAEREGGRVLRFSDITPDIFSPPPT